MKSLIALVGASLCLGGCIGQTAKVGLRVEHRVAAGENSVPLGGAPVRAIALNTGTVPLPLTLENLDQYLFAVEVSTATNARGEFKIEVLDGTPYLIEVQGPPLGELGDAGPWSWVLLKDGKTLVPTPVRDQPSPWPVELHLMP